LLTLVFSDALAQLNFDPPKIIVSNRPVQLMLIDGPPSIVPIAGTRLEFVVNTDRDGLGMGPERQQAARLQLRAEELCRVGRLHYAGERQR